MLLAVYHGDLHDSLCQLHGCFNGGGKPGFNSGFDQQPVDQDFNCVVSPPVQANILIELKQMPINAYPDESFPAQLLK